MATVLGLQNRPGFEVNLVTGPTSGPEGSLESCFAAKRELLTILPSLVRPVHPLRDLQAYRRLREIFHASRPRIVHTHSGKAGILGRLAARDAGVPVIIHTIHGPSFGTFQGAPANWLFRGAERRAGRVTTHFISVADAMTRQYLAAGIGRPEQYTRIFSGFALGPFLEARNDPRLRARLGIEPGDFVVGKIARLFQLKGHDDLIAAAPAILERHPQTKFLLVGDGALRGELEGRVAAGGLAGGLAALGAHLVPGFDLVAAMTGLAARLRTADLVVTGEGHLDPPSFAGKVPGGVLTLTAGRCPVLCIVGDADEALLRSPPPGLEIISLADRFGAARARSETTDLVAEVTDHVVRRPCP